MSRIRTIKPETWEDEKLAALPRDARLLFIGLWNVCDDEGRMRGHPAFVKSKVYPYDDDVDVSALLRSLERGGFIVRYEVDGQAFVWVRNFNRHQKIDRPSKSVFPAPPEASTNARRTLDDDSLLEGKGKEGKGKEQGGAASAREGSQAELVSLPVPEVPKEDPEQRVYDHWRATWSPKASPLLDDKRRKLIGFRLRERPKDRRLQDLLDSLTGWKHDPWSERHQHAALQQLLRDAGQVDKGLELLARAKPAAPPVSEACACCGKASETLLWAKPVCRSCWHEWEASGLRAPDWLTAKGVQQSPPAVAGGAT